MKRILISVAFVLLAITCFAQKQKVSVVELQNGSTIRGVLLESSEGTIKVQTADKSVFVYPLSDVKGITETNQEYKESGLDSRGPQKGKYRGFVDIEGGIPVVMFSIYTFGLETSHGIQLLDWLFLGAGVAAHTQTFKELRMPVFADFRVDIINHSITPYVDVRAGYDMMNIINPQYPASQSGFYLNPNIGCRVVVGKLPLNFSFGGNIYEVASRGHCRWSLSLRAGIEF